MNSKEALKKLREILDEETYNKIIKELAGATVYFPESYEWEDKSSRNDQIREDYYSGQFEIGDLARKYELSISRIYKIIQKR